ncbi:hypothetical protein ROT00_00345 [Agromyces mediolanus]|uniref:hypothetical protein n=1 Tax=Agromyces mediolanus TaxID=41986 RepID=UPI0038358DE2
MVEDALVAGLFDWVGEGQIMYGVINELRIDDPDTRDILVLGAVTVLLAEGYAIPTTYGEPWSVGTGEAIERIATTWLSTKDGVSDIVHLDLTVKGRERGEAIATREGWKAPPRPARWLE